MQCDLTAEEQAPVQPSAMIVVKPQPAEDQWLKHKHFIRTEYLVRDTSLQDLVVLLRSRGLHTKKAQLEYKLKGWGISKNIDKKTWQSIDRKINKRKLEGKNSDVIYCGKRLKQSTINKATGRHRETNIFTQLSQQRSPPPSPTSSQLIVCTPPPLLMDFEWPESLPWLRFCDGYLHRSLDRFSHATVPQPKPGTTRINHLLSTLTGTLSQVDKNDPTTSISKLTSTIGRTMPEWYPGEHLETAQALLTGPSDGLMFDCLRIAIYQMANGMEVESFYDWIAFRDLLLDSGVLHLRIDPELRNRDIIIKAFMDHLFQNEVLWLTSRINTFVRKQWDLIAWLLKSGQDPNLPLAQKLSETARNIVTPLQEAVKAGCPELTELLLDFHAGVDVTQAFCGNRPVMQLVHDSNVSNYTKLHITRLLLPYCDSVNLQEVLLTAKRLRAPDLFLRVIQQEVHLTKTMKVAASRRSLLHEETALSLAIETGGDVTNIVLDYVASQNRPADYVTPDTFIAAAEKGENDIIRRLHQIHPIGGSCNQRNIKPVHAAIKQGYLSTCQLLLQLYDSALDSLVYVATGEGRESILRFLIREGADVNATMVWNDDAPQTTLERLSSTRGRSWSENALKCAAILIDAGARPAGGEVLAFAEYHMKEPLKAALAAGGNPNAKDDCGSSVLQHFLTTNKYSTIRLDTVKVLLEAGATLRGGEIVSAIERRDLDLMALLLRHGGSLSDKSTAGVGCLEAAINAGNDSILQKVFESIDGHYDGESLCAAVQVGNRALVDTLLANRPKRAKWNLLEGTATGLAAKYGNLDLLRSLLGRIPHSTELQVALIPFELYHAEQVLNPITTEDYWRSSSRKCVQGSPLALAVLGQDTKGFQELLQNCYRADKLTWAVVAQTQNIPCLRLLIEHQQRLDNLAFSASQAIAPLNIAAVRRNKMLVQSLLSAGADINECVGSRRVQSPLQLAAKANDLEMVSYLLEKGAQVDKMYVSPLQLAIEKGNSCAVECLLNNEHDGNDSPLQTVVKMGDLDITSCLLEHGADVNHYDRLSARSRSPLQLAVYSGNLDLASYLMDKGADINAPAAFDRGITALQVAAMNGHLGLARKLLEHGARVNARAARQTGRTALEGAAEHGRLDMLELLLHHGALVTGTGLCQFVRAMRLAWREGHHTVVEWLKRSRDWTAEDEALTRGARLFDDEGCKDCREYCCDEIHSSESGCIYDFSDAEEEFYAKKCRCKKLGSRANSYVL